MDKRVVTITIVEGTPDIPLGISTSSHELGRLGDNNVTCLKFVRPEDYVQSNLILEFYFSKGDILEFNIGEDNEFDITDEITYQSKVRFQIRLASVDSVGNKEQIANSNILNFYFTGNLQ